MWGLASGRDEDQGCRWCLRAVRIGSALTLLVGLASEKRWCHHSFGRLAEADGPLYMFLCGSATVRIKLAARRPGLQREVAASRLQRRVPSACRVFYLYVPA